MAGNEELEGQNYQIFIYPNPGNGRNTTLQFIGKNLELVNYTIRDVSGKTIKEAKNHSTSGNKIALDFGPDVQAGSYFVEITGKDGSRLATEKIQIQ